MTYKEAIACLERLQMFTIKMGLASMERLLQRLGNPHKRLHVLHIAGTNGKGSVGATLLAILTAAGYKAGFYSSPHLHSVRERFRIGRQCMPREDFSRLMGVLQPFLAGESPPTYFECATLLALLWFDEQRTDLAILETGMGGRLDATNVVLPLASVITDISLDHEHYLGADIAAIAAEKAGIIKPDTPTVFSGRDAGALPVIRQYCHERHSPLYVFGRHFFGEREGTTLRYRPIRGGDFLTLPLRLAGAHQAINASLALAALELTGERFPVSPDALAEGLRQVYWPGRLEEVLWRNGDRERRILLDGAHNEAGVAALCQALRQGFPRRRLFLLWANMRDKRLYGGLAELIHLITAAVFTRADARRSAEPEAIRETLPPELACKVRCQPDPERALAELLAQAGPEDLLCIAGSLYLVGRLRPLLLPEDHL